MPFKSEVIIDANGWKALPTADNTREATRSVNSLLKPGRMAVVVYFTSLEGKSHINFLAFGQKSADLEKTRQQLKLFVNQKKDRQDMLPRMLGEAWEAAINEGLP